MPLIIRQNATDH